LADARARSDQVDARVAELAGKLTTLADSVAIVALGAYGRQELTPHTEIDLLFLHLGELSTSWVTEAVCYPLWEHQLRVEPTVRTLAECSAGASRSWSVARSFLDARFVAGHRDAFEAFDRLLAQPWRRDRKRLRHRLRADTQHRHANHASATASTLPDVIAGRGGLLDLHALRWLKVARDEQLLAALDFYLRTQWSAEEHVNHVPHRLPARLQEHLAKALELGTDRAAFLTELYHHARWIAFKLDGALAAGHEDRPLGMSLAVRHGELTGERLPPLERAPHVGLRAANLTGLAPPDAALLAWAAASGPPLRWDEPTLAQLWLLLRAADWRAWEFLDVTGLLTRYLPELEAIRGRIAPSAVDDLALDSHSFLALRRLHDWTESGDPLAERAWRPLRRRDWLYLAVLLHELSPEAATAVAHRLGLPDEASDALAFVVANQRVLSETATRRDLNDEDLLLELATRIHNRQRLSLVFLAAVAHDLASGPNAWTAWKADLMRQLFGRLEAALQQPRETGRRRTRSLEQHRERVIRELERRDLHALVPLAARLPRRYVLTRSPSFVARHLSLLAGEPLADGEVRMQAARHRQPGLWDVLIVARDRPGLLATVAGVLALRGASTLGADAATCSDGLVLDVFTVGGAYGQPLERTLWPALAADIQSAVEGRVPLRDLLGARPLPPEEAAAIHVTVDNAASQFFSVVEVRAPDQVGLLYRIADGLHELGLDIHQARIATHPDGALDVFYVWDLSGEKLDEPTAARTARDLTLRLSGA
jgi:[protein-PII] uridylyltransferase